MDRKEQHIRDLLRRWISGDITAREESDLRRAAQDDPVVRDALAGYESFPEADHEANLNRLRGKLSVDSRSKVRPMLVWRVAAAVLLLLVASYWFFPGFQNETSSATAMMDEATEMEREMTPPATPAIPEPDQLAQAETAPEAVPPAVASRSQANPKVFAQESSPKSESPGASFTEEMADANMAGSGASDSALMAADTPARNDKEEVLGRLAAEPLPVEDDVVVAAPPPPPPPPPAAQNQGYPSRLEDLMRATNVGPPMATSGFKVVEGRIFDIYGEPLIGASILEQGSTNGTVADFDGFYRIAVREEGATLEVTYTGFDKKEVAVADQSTLDIILEESALALDEVVVTGYGRRDKRREQSQEADDIVNSAAPIDGFRALRRYIDERTPAGTARTRISLQFVLGTDGQLSDFEVLSSTNEALNDFAIDLIENGPRWIVESGAAPMTVTYNMTLKN